jgi:hypothetical protein
MEDNNKFKRPIVPISPLRKPDRSWARSTGEKSLPFAKHLASVFTPNSDNHDDIAAYLNAPCQLSLPVRAFTTVEIRNAINLLNPQEARGHDRIVVTILKNLPRKAILLITYIYNSILRPCHFPFQWKLAQIIMISKPGKPLIEVTSYRPISFLPIMGQVFKRLLLIRIEEAVPLNKLILPYHFSLCENHSTAKQCHTIINKIRDSLEAKKMCFSVFLDVQQAFDKVWHEGLLHKLKSKLPDQFYLALKSYL